MENKNENVINKLKRGISEKHSNLKRIINMSPLIKLIILLIIPITILTYFLNKENIFIRPYEVERGSYGKEKTPYKVNVDVGDIHDMEFDFSVSSVRFTEDELDNIFDKLYQEQKISLLGKNEDYHHIKYDLDFKSNLGNGINMKMNFRPERFEDEIDEDNDEENKISSISEINGNKKILDNVNEIKINNNKRENNNKEKISSKSEILGNKKIDDADYYAKYQNIIDTSGKVHNKNLSSDEVVEGFIVLRFTTHTADREGLYKSDEYFIEAKVLKGDTTPIYELKTDLANKIEEIDKDTLDKKYLKLPRVIDDKIIIYKNKTNYSFLFVPVLLIAVCIILYVKTKFDEKEEEKRVNELLKIDYPQIITKILIYVSSGLTMRNSIRLIANTYEKKKEKGYVKEKRKAYEEMILAKKKLDNGVGEITVYEEMASNIKDRTYTRFINIITQSIKNGNKDIKNILNLEVQDALFERKQRAKKLGEEASTKLVLPLMLMLLTIMIIIMVPAFMGMK